MKKKWKIPYILACLSFCLISMGMEFEGAWAKVLESLPTLGVEGKEFDQVPKVKIFSIKEGDFIPVLLENPLYKQNQKTLISLEDINALTQRKKVHFNEENNILTIQQIKRIYMAVNKAAYLEQNQLKPTDVAPIIKEGEVYVPLRFVLERLGYMVNFNPVDKEILVIPNLQNEEKIVAKDKIQIREIDQAQPWHDRIQVVSLCDGGLLATGQEPGGIKTRLLRIDPDGEILTSDQEFTSTNERFFGGNQEEILYKQEALKLYSLDMKRGFIDDLDIPKKLVNTTFFAKEDGAFYSYDGRDLYSFNPSSKKIKKVHEDENIGDLFIHEGTLYGNKNGKLFKYELGTEEFEIIKDFSTKESLKIHKVAYPYIFYMDMKNHCFEVVSLETKEKKLILPFSEKYLPEVTITGNNYICIEKKNSLFLHDLGSGKSMYLDLANIKEELNRGNVSWYWGGGPVLGHWKYKIELEERVNDQIIELQI